MTGFFKDLFTGNWTALEDDVSSGVAKLPSWAQTLVTTLETGEGQILSGLVQTASQDVIKGGLTTASFVTAAKDVITQLIAQEIKLGEQLVYAALNAAVAEAAATPVVGS